MPQAMPVGGGRRGAATDDEADVALRGGLPGGVGVKAVEDGAGSIADCNPDARGAVVGGEARTRDLTAPGAERTVRVPICCPHLPAGCPSASAEVHAALVPAPVMIQVSDQARQVRAKLGFGVIAGAILGGPPHPSAVPPASDLTSAFSFSLSTPLVAFSHATSLSLFLPAHPSPRIPP